MEPYGAGSKGRKESLKGDPGLCLFHAEHSLNSAKVTYTLCTKPSSIFQYIQHREGDIKLSKHFPRQVASLLPLLEDPCNNFKERPFSHSAFCNKREHLCIHTPKYTLSHACPPNFFRYYHCSQPVYKCSLNVYITLPLTAGVLVRLYPAVSKK